MPLKTILYTKEGCHLCHEAEDVLRRYGLVPELVDIESDPILEEKYRLEIPVVSIDGVVRFRGRVNEVLLKRILR